MGAVVTKAEDVLAFWFEESPQQAWFEKDPAFDARIRDRFLGTLEAARNGALDHWAGAPASALALLIVLDQFSRNLFRGDGRAYAADGKARDLARTILWRGWHQEFRAERKLFCYLPFEHSERLADQHRSVALFAATGMTRWIQAAEAHRDIIARFGRFPHRNASLGRESTPEELAFLEQPNSSF